MYIPPNPGAQAKYSKLFTAKVPISPDQLNDVDVILPKKLRHAAGDKQFILYQNMATASIEHKFGVASHYVTGSEDAEEGDQTRPQFIQQQFVIASLLTTWTPYLVFHVVYEILQLSTSLPCLSTIK